ncbi:hypothetical protein FOMG_17611 [Fusarium oxysporum f. sp. melonis 26406]|uniref:Uncharacterized protein n=1 Tax=Fusarium oxysporum f. sp. melonis 26406 TaxID=1089452 RepID=W9ZAY1_FUSOX|nr:hypothetical protein FOMG_17611 [Fusarium oxysporum f. sp. melonis 26406]
MTLTPKLTADSVRDHNNPGSTSRNESDHPYKSPEADIRAIRDKFLESNGLSPSIFAYTHGSQKTPDQAVIHEDHVAIGGLQVNGQILQGRPGSDLANYQGQPAIYRRCVQFGPGDQVNGDIVYYHGGNAEISTSTTYDSMICGSTRISDNLPDGNTEIKGTQHNGPIIKSRKNQD